MATLSRIAEGIAIGTGALALFMNGIPGYSCNGGLFSYTSARNFRRMNTVNNYEWGSRGRYGYNSYGSSEIEDTTGGKVPFGIGLGYGRSFTYSNAIGDGYSTNDMTTNAPLRFVTKDEFTYFESLLRENNLGWNRDNHIDSEEFRVEDYALRASDWQTPYNVSFYKLERGDQYSTNDIEGFGVSHADVIAENRKFIDAHADYQRVNPFIGRKLPIAETGNLFGDIFSLPDVERKAAVESMSETFYNVNGVYTYYTVERNEYKRKYDNREKQGFFRYNWQMPYAVGDTNMQRDADYYDTSEGNVSVDGTVQPEAKAGEFITKGKNARYSFNYYEERDGKANTPPSLREIDTMDNSHVSNTLGDNVSGLIRRTNELFRQGSIETLINRFHTLNEDLKGNELITSFDERFGLSHGRNLLKKNPDRDRLKTGYSNPYCRVWTAHHQYSKLRDRIRPFYDGDNAQSVGETQKNLENMRPRSGNVHLNDHTVLQPNGFVRITPKQSDNFSTDTLSKDNARKYMFSIENLAWRGYKDRLSPEQKGPYGGRIMWFPPYNLKFTENINTNWNGNQFIGRGEQIYTYINTERTGTLSFTILIDHPSILNKWMRVAKNANTDSEREERQQEILRYFAGCDDLSSSLSGNIGIVEPPQQKKDEEEKIDPKPTNKATKQIAYVIFFPNNFSCKDYPNIEEGVEKLKMYETANPIPDFTEQDASIKNKVYDNHNKSLFQLNYNPSEETRAKIKQMLLGDANNDVELRFLTGDHCLTDLSKEFTGASGETVFGMEASTCKVKEIVVAGFASSHGYVSNNKGLHTRRNGVMKRILKHYCSNITDDMLRNDKNRTIEMTDDTAGIERDINALEAKIARSAYAMFTVEWEMDNTVTGDNGAPDGTYETESGLSINNVVIENGVQTVTNADNSTTVTVVDVKTSPKDFTYNNEYLFFEEIGNGASEMMQKNIVDKVKYFNPTFHSITPEGFNARLTFLQQCTRQGPTPTVSNADTNSEDYVKYAGNLAFGRAPYCVLRIGDFFNTKICIDAISIDYSNGDGIQWDLNPEGAGVQPMFADVNINFKFIGGQDIGGTVAALQNAISSNYYANTSIYDDSSTRIN